ncbi:unnamed protein product [Ranitomeya imitator]|uniref:MADF domain-containing protein n=1 Tax=Ranitomeya imitator TaxID=111125 RepID=A0ABN9M5S9_9NEOB|nr:unnamed protein product [Ranitomeya imitator]
MEAPGKMERRPAAGTRTGVLFCLHDIGAGSQGVGECMGKSRASNRDPPRRIPDFFAATPQPPPESKMAPSSPRASRSSQRNAQVSRSGAAALHPDGTALHSDAAASHFGGAALNSGGSASDAADGPVTASLLKGLLGDLRSSIQEDLRSMLAELRGEVAELGNRTDRLERKMAELVSSHNELWDAHESLQTLAAKTHAKALDLEDRSRRNNVKLRGIEESVLAGDLKPFLQDFMAAALPHCVPKYKPRLYSFAITCASSAIYEPLVSVLFGNTELCIVFALYISFSLSTMSANDQEFVRALINMYRSLPCLWKIKFADYSIHYKKKAAYEKLVALYKEHHPTETVDENIVRKKIQALRTVYKKEMNKVEKSMKSGAGTDDVYVPKLWYYDLLAFTRDQEIIRP